jgi:predicted RNA methylase
MDLRKVYVDEESGELMVPMYYGAAVCVVSDEAEKRAIMLRLKSRFMVNMLNDRKRNKLYELAIMGAMKRLNGELKMVDIGLGTGLLSCLACKHMMKGSSVVGLEMNEFMAHNCAQKVIDENKFADKIKILSAHSKDYDFDKVDLIFCEIFDSQPFNEGIIPTFHDIYKKKSCKALSIPHSIKFYGVLVHIKNKKLLNRIYNNAAVIDSENVLKSAFSSKYVFEPYNVNYLRVSTNLKESLEIPWT